MGQKVNPFGFRLGIYEDWLAHWFAKKSYAKELIEDLRIREYLKKRLNDGDIAKVVIEKVGRNVRLIVHTSRPGVVIGKQGQGIDRLRADLNAKFGKNIDVSVQEIRNPDLNSAIVAKGIAEQLEKRASFKRVMKKVGFAALKSGAKGIYVCAAGRLGGAEIARTEWLRLGSVPRHTLRAKIDYGVAEAKTIYGIIGIKVWIYLGEYQ